MAGDPQFSLCPELAAIALKDLGETPEKRSTAYRRRTSSQT